MKKERVGFAFGLAMLSFGIAVATGALASPGPGARTCAAVASVQSEACRAESKADSATARAVCLTLTDAADRAACFGDAKSARDEASAECRDQRSARRDLCEELGGGPYDPPFDPADHDTDFASPAHENPYFPLAIGDRWEFAGEDEAIEIEVQDETKLIDGVTCVVVRDRASLDGVVVEDTDVLFAHAKDGAVHYCGEISQSLELFPGDEPLEPELVSIDGSWKAGRDGAQSGTLFPAAPTVGLVYRQEFAPGIAEDAARILSTTYGFGSDPDLDALVPQALAELLCAADDCVVTAEFAPLDPGALEHKYYAAGVGLFLETNPEDGEVVQLVDCNVDPRCDSLPQP
jgi:hypothetical protein